METDSELKLVNAVSKVLNIPAGNVTDEVSPDNTSSWDSMGHLMLVSELESTFGAKFTTDEVMTLKNLKDIKNLLREKGVII